MSLRRFLRILEYAHLFFALVILSSLLWAGAGLILVGFPLWFVSLGFVEYSKFAGFSDQTLAIFAVYIAGMSGSIGFFWGLKRWRRHLSEQAEIKK